MELLIVYIGSGRYYYTVGQVGLEAQNCKLGRSAVKGQWRSTQQVLTSSLWLLLGTIFHLFPTVTLDTGIAWRTFLTTAPSSSKIQRHQLKHEYAFTQRHNGNILKRSQTVSKIRSHSTGFCLLLASCLSSTTPEQGIIVGNVVKMEERDDVVSTNHQDDPLWTSQGGDRHRWIVEQQRCCFSIFDK